jgi:hypothetical protein
MMPPITSMVASNNPRRRASSGFDPGLFFEELIVEERTETLPQRDNQYRPRFTIHDLRFTIHDLRFAIYDSRGIKVDNARQIQLIRHPLVLAHSNHLPDSHR